MSSFVQKCIKPYLEKSLRLVYQAPKLIAFHFQNQLGGDRTGDDNCLQVRNSSNLSKEHH